MSSRAVKNKLPRIIFMYQPSAEVAQGPHLFAELKWSLMTVLKMSLWWLPAPPPTASLHTRSPECVFLRLASTLTFKSKGQRQQFSCRHGRKKKPHFAPAAPPPPQDGCVSPSRGCAQENVHAAFVFTCAGALVLDVWNSQTPLGPVSISRSSFCLCLFSNVAPRVPFSHFFSGQNSRGWDGRSH